MNSYDGFVVDDNFNIFSERTGNKLSPYIGSDGYMHVQYRDINGKHHHNRVHVIFAHLFIPNPNNEKYINHIDSNKLNNDLSNLEWCSNSYNVYHGWHSGNRTHKNRTHVVVMDLNHNIICKYQSIRECGNHLRIDRHKIARVLKGELDADYLGYLFRYDES